MVISNDDELLIIANEMKNKDVKNKSEIMKNIYTQPTLTAKCLHVRCYLNPQSTDFETLLKKELEIGPPINETSGDGNKNGVNYEIKTSIHAKKSKINFVQIRPDHNIDYYIFIAYNLYENETIGNAHIFKVPSNIIYNLIVQYGSYAHGTCAKFGKITLENIKGRNCEYALRCDPNATKGKSYDLWNILKTYEVEYNANNF